MGILLLLVGPLMLGAMAVCGAEIICWFDSKFKGKDKE
jgi:hypothetical protein